MTARPAVLAFSLLAACTAAPETLDLPGDDPDLLELDDDGLRIPDGVRTPAPPPDPDTETLPESATSGTIPRYVLGGRGDLEDCVWAASEGMPAIDTTGVFVAVTHEQVLQLSTIRGPVALHIEDLDVHGASVDLPVLEDGRFDDERDCRSLRARVRRRVRAANAELGRHRWRTLERLAVEYGHPDAPADAYADTPVAERPLQVIVQHGEAIARIPGVEVFERHPIPGRDGDSLYEVRGDRTTGTVVLTFADCQGDSCTCDPAFTTEILHWDAATFAALDAHPCSDPEADDGLCRGVDYGF